MAQLAQLTTAEYTARFNDQMSSGAKAAAEAMESLARAAENTDAKARRSSSSLSALEARLDAGARLAQAKARANEQLARQTETLNAAVARGMATQERANELIALATQRRDLAVAATQRQIAAEEARNRALLGGTATATSSASAVQAMAAANDNAARSSGRFGQAMGQAGFQIQDFATQVSMGQNVLTAFGVQFAQFAGMFGVGGAIAGAVLTVSLLTYQILGAGDATKELDRAVRGSEDAYARAQRAGEEWQRGLAEEAAVIQRLTVYYANLDQARRAYEVRSLEAARRQLQDSALTTTEDAASGLRGFDAGLRNAIAAAEARRARGQAADAVPANLLRAQDALAGFNAQRADDPSGALVRLADALAEASRQGGPYADAMTRIVEQLDRAVPAADRLTRQLNLNAAQLDAARGESDPAAAGIAGVGLAASGAAAQIGQMAASLRSLAAIATADPLAEIERDIGRTTAQLVALRRGGLGGLAAERDAQERSRAGEEAFTRMLREQTEAYERLGLQRAEAERRATEAAGAARLQAEMGAQRTQTLRDEEAAARDAQRNAEQRAREAERAAEQRARAAKREAERARDLIAQDERRELERRERENERTTDSITRYLADSFADAFKQTGGGFDALLRSMQQMALTTPIRIGVEAIARPIVGSVVSSLGLGQGAGGLMSALGLGGLASGAAGILSTPLWVGSAGAIAGAGMFAEAAPAAMGMSNMAGAGLVDMGPTLGATLGVAGLGALGGGMLASMTGGNATGGSIGGGLGAAAGFMLGGPVGALLGGALGGFGGGRFGGSGRRNPAFHVGVGTDADGMLAITGAGQKHAAQQLDQLRRQTEQEITQFNAQLRALGLTVSGAATIGNEQRAQSLAAATGDFRLISGDARIQGAIDRAGGTLAQFGVAQEAVQFTAALKQLSDAAADAADPLAAVRRQFEGLFDTSRRLGFGLDEVTAAQTRALEQARRQAQGPARSLLEQLTFGGQSALTPESRGFSAITALNEARRGIGTQDGLQEFVRVAGLALPAIRDVFGTTERYGSLVADVAATLRGATGNDFGGLATLLEASVAGTDRTAEAILSIGGDTNDLLSRLLSEFSTLRGTVEALARRTAAA